MYASNAIKLSLHVMYAYIRQPCRIRIYILYEILLLMGNTKSLMIYPALCARISSFLEKGNSARARSAQMRRIDEAILCLRVYATCRNCFPLELCECRRAFIYTYIPLYALHLCIFEKFPSQYVCAVRLAYITRSIAMSWPIQLCARRSCPKLLHPRKEEHIFRLHDSFLHTNTHTVKLLLNYIQYTCNIFQREQAHQEHTISLRSKDRYLQYTRARRTFQ